MHKWALNDIKRHRDNVLYYILKRETDIKIFTCLKRGAQYVDKLPTKSDMQNYCAQ